MAVVRGQTRRVLRFNRVGIPKLTLDGCWVGALWFTISRGKISMRQKRRLIRSDGIARNLLWLLILLILVCAVLVVRNCHG